MKFLAAANFTLNSLGRKQSLHKLWSILKDNENILPLTSTAGKSDIEKSEFLKVLSQYQTLVEAFSSLIMMLRIKIY